MRACARASMQHKCHACTSQARPLHPSPRLHTPAPPCLHLLPCTATLPVLQATPLGPLLSAMGVKVGSGGDPSGVTLEGPLAAVARRAAYLYRQPTNEQRLNVAANWLSQAGGLAGALLGALPGMGGQGGR